MSSSSPAPRKSMSPASRQRLKRAMIRMVLYLVVVPYLFLLFYAVFFSDGIIFQPQRVRYRESPELFRLTDASGTTLSALYMPNEKAERTILYSYGNAEDLDAVRPELERLRVLGFAVLSYDYPGYGMSGGAPSENGAYRAINAAYAYLTQTRKVPPERIVVMGRSLGSGVSVDLASREKVGGLILQSPFKSAFRVLTNWRILPFDKFNSLAKIERVTCPVLIAHGTRDEVIPLHHGQTLFEAAHEPKQFHAVSGATHNDVFEVGGKNYQKVLLDFMRTLHSAGK